MSKIIWKIAKSAHINEAHDAAKLWEEKPTDIEKVLLNDGTSYVLKFHTEEGYLYVQKFNIATCGSLSPVKESSEPVANLIVKSQRQVRSTRRTNKKPVKVYLVPNPPLEEYLPGPERKVTQWRYEQARKTIDELREFYTTQFQQPCEIYEVLLVRYPNCNQEFEFYKTKEGHIVSRTLYDPLKFPRSDNEIKD